jgi:hypothetical protein
MQVSRRPALLSELVLQNEDTAVVLRGHLEVNGANAESPLLAESVIARGDAEDRRKTGWNVQRIVHNKASVCDRRSVE